MLEENEKDRKCVQQTLAKDPARERKWSVSGGGVGWMSRTRLDGVGVLGWAEPCVWVEKKKRRGSNKEAKKQTKWVTRECFDPRTTGRKKENEMWREKKVQEKQSALIGFALFRLNWCEKHAKNAFCRSRLGMKWGKRFTCLSFTIDRFDFDLDSCMLGLVTKKKMAKLKRCRTKVNAHCRDSEFRVIMIMKGCMNCACVSYYVFNLV